MYHDLDYFNNYFHFILLHNASSLLRLKNDVIDNSEAKAEEQEALPTNYKTRAI